MTAKIGAYTAPNAPWDKVAALQENERRGYRPVPGMSDHEQGTILRAEDPTLPLYVPPLPLPPWGGHRRAGSWPTVLLILGIVAIVAAMCAVVTR